MKTITMRLVILVACLTTCAGCGTRTDTHRIDVVLEPEPGGLPVTNFQVGIAGNIVRESSSKIQLQSPNSNCVVQFDYKDQATSFAWQKRSPYVSFALYVPAVSTNGQFCFSFADVSKLPTRGLKQGKVDIRPMYIEFDRWDQGLRMLPVIHTEVKPAAKGGYHITLHLPIRALRDGLAAEFVTSVPKADKTK